MKIVHVITRLIVGGAQENTLLSCEGQHARGHEVTLVTGPPAGPEGSLLQRAQASGYRVQILPSLCRAIRPMTDWRAWNDLADLFRSLQPDIVHTHSSKGGILGRWAARTARMPRVIHTIHGLAFTASTHAAINLAYRLLEKQAAPLTSRIVCVADAMRDQSLAAGIGSPDQYVTVYSGMETSAFLNPPVPRAAVRQQLHLEDHHIAVGTIARLFDLKGHDDLLDLAPSLCRQYPNLVFLWIGDGSLRSRFEARITQMGLKDRFRLTGLVPPNDIPQLTGAMDILVHPSRREGLARAIPQGQLAGCPVVTYDIDGNREGLLDNITGYLIRPFDRDQLGESLARLLADADRRRTMGQAGRAFATRRFDTRVMVDALEQVYRNCPPLRA